jgi:TatD DNase family protein
MPDALIDSHCHVDDHAFDEDRGAVLERAQRAGVVGIINPASSIVDSRAVVKLAHQHPAVFAAVGIHPNEVGSDIQKLDAAFGEVSELAKDPEVVAIGEFGLDTKHGTEHLAQQKEAMRRQLTIARDRSLPVILHCRQAYQELVEVVRQSGGDYRGVVHCFAGGPAELKLVLEAGFYVAYGGLVTFEKNTQALREALAQTPLNRMLIETDAPYLTPVPRRGTRNEPNEVATVARFIAELRGIPYSELAHITTENARTLFRLPDAIETQTNN